MLEMGVELRHVVLFGYIISSFFVEIQSFSSIRSFFVNMLRNVLALYSFFLLLFFCIFSADGVIASEIASNTKKFGARPWIVFLFIVLNIKVLKSLLVAIGNKLTCATLDTFFRLSFGHSSYLNKQKSFTLPSVSDGSVTNESASNPKIIIILPSKRVLKLRPAKWSVQLL